LLKFGAVKNQNLAQQISLPTKWFDLENSKDQDLSL